MSLPRYSEYKDSGLPWLGAVPKHWESWKVSHAFGAIGSGTTPPSDDAAWYADGAIPWITTGELREAVVYETAKCVTATAMEKFRALRLHPAGSLAVAMYGATIGRLGILGVDATTNQACCVLSRPHSLDVRFVFHWLQGFKQVLIDLFATGGGQPNINQETIASLRIPAPTLTEQTAIATFLDRETAKIDTLIAEQDKLIALLAEKRQATISHAVTKGLNPDVSMKDSGVAWLGEVPAHWNVKKLRHIADVVRGASPRPAGDPEFFSSDNESGLNCPWVTVAEVTKDDSPYLTEVAEYLTPAGVERSQSFASGSLIFTNSGATLGVPKILSVNCCANDGILAFKQLSSDVEIRFLYLFLLTTTERLRTEMKQGGGQPNLNTGIVKDISLALPPITEQREVIDYVETRLGQFDALRAEAARAIAFLAERRTALISAAVTGKIDVRAPRPM